MVIFHHNDADGCCAAAVVLYALELDLLAGDGADVTVKEIDYKDADAVDFIKDVKPDEHVIIVDFSFKPAKFKELMQVTKYVTWCDHHVTAGNYDYARESVPHVYGQRIDGLRDFTDKGLSGAEVTWKHFMCGIPIPPAVQLLGDYDAWRMLDKERCLPFYEGLKLEDNNPEGTMWPVLFTEGDGERTAGIIRNGEAAIQYRDAYCGKMRTNFGYMVNFDGLNCYACNIYMFGSKGFGELMDLFDACISYVHDGKTRIWTVSLYSQKRDVGQVAKRHGGGGHAGAAGFTCCELPWMCEECGKPLQVPITNGIHADCWKTRAKREHEQGVDDFIHEQGG